MDSQEKLLVDYIQYDDHWINGITVDQTTNS